MAVASRPRSGRLVSALVALAASVCAASGAAAQTATAPDLTAAFLFNFAKFTEWPADALAPAAPLTICIVGDQAVAQSLEQAAKGHDIDSHHITVRRLKPDELVRPCHMVYAGGVDKTRALALIEAAKGAAIFTVSDLATFSAMGGTAHLFPENGRMRFAVNVESAQRARLRLSSQMLSLAKLVKDDPHATPR